MLQTGVGRVTDDIIRYLEGQHQTILERLKTVLRLPSVSTDPAYADGMAATRAHFLQRLKEMGLDDVQLLDGGGHPALYGAWRGAPGAPTFIIYGHYDVQPPDPLELWHTPPFDPTIRGLGERHLLHMGWPARGRFTSKSDHYRTVLFTHSGPGCGALVCDANWFRHRMQ